ncbi:caspase-10 isoform X2 [Sciurus carolinensis]|nr:caspase-10 isoform X2 [Sciurus carolinensis]
MATTQDQNPGSSSDENCLWRFREKLLAIDEELKVQDVESLKFLCIGFISQNKLEKSSSALDLFDHLMARELLSVKETFFLAELLYTIKQNRLLHHLGYTKKQVEGLLPTQRKLSLFRKLLFELSEGIGEENLKDIIFLLGDNIPKTPMTSLSLLDYLEKKTEIDEDNLIILEKAFQKILPCLIKKIENYKREKAAQEATPPVDKETESLHQGEEGIFSPSDIKQFYGALPEVPWQNEHSRNHGNGAANAVPIPVSGATLGASNTLGSETWTKETSMYRMDRKHRGHCVIINNHRFTSSYDRPGTHKDAESLQLVFEWLGFTTHRHDDVTKGVMDKILQEYKSHPGHDDGDCFVFCILTHGEFGAVYSSDGVLIPIREITHHFTAYQCPGLARKPKLFFIQACQGTEIQPSVFIEADAQNCEQLSLQDSVPNEADFLLGLATVPGYVSFRHIQNGSWYIQSLCKHLKKLVPRQEDILSILTAVNDDVSQQMCRDGTRRQIPQPAFTLRKKIVFPVPRLLL